MTKSNDQPEQKVTTVHMNTRKQLKVRKLENVDNNKNDEMAGPEEEEKKQ